jgi:hypothetical protein
LKEFGDHALENKKESFNLLHSSLQTTIERGFGIWKKSLCVLDAEPFWSFQTQVDVVLACCIIHNHIMVLILMTQLWKRLLVMLNLKIKVVESTKHEGKLKRKVENGQSKGM